MKRYSALLVLSLFLLSVASVASAQIYSAGTHTYTVPSGIGSLQVKMWGAGGSEGETGRSIGSCDGYTIATVKGNYGGGGGYAEATIPVTVGETLTFVVGAKNGGGTIGNPVAGAGGGYSGIFRGSVSQTNALLVAGGGGGSAGWPCVGGPAGTCGYSFSCSSGGPQASNLQGGAGGGTVGVTTADGAGGGTQTSGGAPVEYGNSSQWALPGGALQGGTGQNNYGGGGGAGYWGGAGGPSYNAQRGGGGAGGSGYCGPTVGGCVLVAGSGSTAANASDSERPAGAGDESQGGAILITPISLTCPTTPPGAGGTYPSCTCPSGYTYNSSTNTCDASAPPPPPPPPADVAPTCSISSVTSPVANGGSAIVSYTTTNTPTNATFTYTLPAGVTANPVSKNFTPVADGQETTSAFNNSTASNQTVTINMGVSNSAGSASCSGSTIVQPTASAAPAVSTNNASNITGSSATLNGAITSVGSGNATARGFAWGTSANLSSAATTTESGSFSTGSFSFGASGLTVDTRYYFRAYASNPAGTSFGAIRSFVAQNPVLTPSVVTSAASNVTASGATLNGIITSVGSGNATARGFAWGTSPSLTSSVSTTTSSGSFGFGSFNYSASGLTTGTTYYFRAYATNGSGTGFGTIRSFVANASVSAPTVTTEAASSITSTSATLNGTGNPNGSASSGWFRLYTSNPFFCNSFSGSRVPASGGSSLGAGTSPVPFSQPIAGLTGGNTYYFCAFAQNSVGTGMGSLRSFTADGGVVVPAGSISQGLLANPTRVRSGSPTSLSWTTTNMVSCTVTDHAGSTISTELSSNGTTVPNITARTVFQLSCTDGLGSVYGSQVTVSILPTYIEI